MICFFGPDDRIYEAFITITTRNLDAIAQRKGKATAILWILNNTETELWEEPLDPVLDAVAAIA